MTERVLGFCCQREGRAAPGSEAGSQRDRKLLVAANAANPQAYHRPTQPISFGNESLSLASHIEASFNKGAWQYLRQHDHTPYTVVP